jgi:hypothetical protein
MTLSKDAPFDIKLSSGRESRPYGLILERGSLQISAVSQDDSIYVRNVGKKVGDFDEQRSWQGGRGHEKFDDNAEGYWDSLNAWTMTKGHVHNGILWRFATGLRKATTNFSPSKSWKALVGASLGISVSFTPLETGNYKYILLWMRWRGSNAATNTLTLKLCSDSGGSPGSVLQTVTLGVNNIDNINGRGASGLRSCEFSSTQALTSGTTYHIFIYGDSTSNDAGHYEVAVDVQHDLSKISANPSAGSPTWTAPTPSFSMLYRIVDTDTNRKFFPFFLDNHLYVVDVKDDGATASQLYINGDRGKATSATSTTLTDTAFGVRAAGWDTNMWNGNPLVPGSDLNAYVRIVRGTGRGQSRIIASNTSDTLTVQNAWDQTPDTTSEYVIYHTNIWQELTSTGLGVVTGEPAVLGNIVYFPQGTGTAIREMALDYTAATNHKYRSEAAAGHEYASLLMSAEDKADGAIMWRALNSTVTASYAKVVSYGSNLTFNTAISCGDASYLITGLRRSKDGMRVFKENGPGIIVGNTYTFFESGQEDTPDNTNGIASVSVGDFVYYNWLHSVVRVYGSSYDDIGQDYSSFGLPDKREGVIAYMDAYITTVLAAVDAGTAGKRSGGTTSSVLMWDGLAWHELIRAYTTNKRIRMVKAQPCPEARNLIWTDMGGELVYQEMPMQKKDPLLDSGMLYQHESVIESSIIDMGTASDLPKFIKSLTATVNNLNNEGMEVYLDYQVDNDCHTLNWTQASILTQSPESTAFLGLSNIRRFVYRLRLNTDTAGTPADVEGIVPTGYARTPLKLMWTMRIKAGGIYQVGNQTAVSSQKLWKWLMDNARFPFAVYMESKYESADGYHVAIHPPRQAPYRPGEPGQPEESYMTLTLEEL